MKKGDRFHWVSKVCVSNRWNASAISSFDSTFRYAWDAEIKRAQSPSQRRRAVAILRLARGRASARARSGTPRHSGNCHTIAQSGPMAPNTTQRFSTQYYDSEYLGMDMYRYEHRIYAPRFGRWLSTAPIGERGGLNLYGFCGNDPINKWDYLGMIFGITYVQFDGRFGHGWIRTGGFTTRDISGFLEKYVEVNGVTHRVNSVTATLPIGIGFYPAEEVTPLKALWGVTGKWEEEIGKEILAITTKESLKEWDTKLKRETKWWWLGLVDNKLEYGDNKGKCCKNVNREDVVNCIMDYTDKNAKLSYRLPFLHCRARAKDALSACCLKVGDRIPTTVVGDIRIDLTPVGGTKQ